MKIVMLDGYVFYCTIINETFMDYLVELMGSGNTLYIQKSHIASIVPISPVFN